MPRVKKFPIIGGPLDGEYANRKDWFTEYRSPHYNQDAGQFAEYRDEYSSFNSAGMGTITTMMYIHNSMLREPIKDVQRPIVSPSP